MSFFIMNYKGKNALNLNLVQFVCKGISANICDIKNLSDFITILISHFIYKTFVECISSNKKIKKV